MPTIDNGFVPRRHQWEIYENLRRFNVLLAHRRFGKTVFAINLLIRRLAECSLPNPRVHYFAPTYGQAKRVAWDYAKQYTQCLIDRVVNESELRIDFPGGGRLQLGSAENPDANRGIYSDFAILDEPAQMPSVMWTEVLRPALSDRRGGLLMIGTPKGRHGLFYDSYQEAVSDPEWWRGCYKASETKVLPQEELDSAKRKMSKGEYEQEYECSFSANIKGAYYGEIMNDIESEGRITKVPYNDRLPVHLSMDLGISDATAVWAFQYGKSGEETTGGEYNFIDYFEFTSMGIPEITRELRNNRYTWGTAIVPHDIKVRSLSSGVSRRDTMESLGWELVIANDDKAVPVIDGINMARSRLKVSNFDAERCRYGIECLRQYCSEWDEVRGTLRQKPRHDWASHGADAYRYFAITDPHLLTNEGWDEEVDYSTLDRLFA